LQEFEAGSSQPALARGAAVLPAIAGRNLSLAGCMSELQALGHTVAPLLWAATGASGPVQQDALEQFWQIMLEELRAAGPVDAVALSLQGAMIATHIPDADGEIAGRLRAVLGAAVPIVAMVDWHANISPLLVMAASSIHAERTCPARGADGTGRRAARSIDAGLRAQRPLRRAFRRLPFVIPLAASAPDALPAAGVLARLLAAEAQPGVDHLAFTAGFQGADVAHAGPAVLGYGEDGAAVERAVAAVAESAIAARSGWRAAALDPQAAVAQALAVPHGPVLLVEIDDDPDAGGTGDCMALARALLAAGVPDAVLGIIYEPHVATIAQRAGIGAVLPLALGAKHGLPGDAPLAGMFRVEALAEEPCRCDGPIHAGAMLDPGPLAVLRLEGLRIIVAAKRLAADDRQLFAHAGVPPESVAILAVKSALAHRADLAGLAARVIPVASTGAMPPDPAALPYRHLRRGLAPA
jgi:microcystin degradation protein MlrC